jgi:hypothetical protein
MVNFVDRTSKATKAAFGRVGNLTKSSTADNEVADYMKLTPSDFAKLVSEFGMPAVEPYIRQMEMRRLRERGNHGT